MAKKLLTNDAELASKCVTSSILVKRKMINSTILVCSVNILSILFLAIL